MKGLAINFSGDKGATLAVGTLISGFNCFAQNGLVNIACGKGSDTIFPDKGTNLYKDALAGRVPNFSEAYHASNFAALDTTFFLKQYENPNEEGIKSIILNPFSYVNNRLKLSASFIGTLDTTVGITETL